MLKTTGSILIYMNYDYKFCQSSSFIPVYTFYCLNYAFSTVKIIVKLMILYRIICFKFFFSFFFINIYFSFVFNNKSLFSIGFFFYLYWFSKKLVVLINSKLHFNSYKIDDRTTSYVSNCQKCTNQLRKLKVVCYLLQHK